jgi:hypothetical protein
MLFLVLILIGFNESDPSISSTQQSPDTASITLTQINFWCVNPSLPNGIDVLESAESVEIAFTQGGQVQLFDPNTAQVTSAGSMPPGAQYSYGVAFGDNSDSPPLCLIHSYGYQMFYSTDWFVTWDSAPSTIGNCADLDFDGSHFWAANFSDTLYRFQPGGSIQAITLNPPLANPHCICVFPYQSSFGIAVKGNNGPHIVFYTWNGSTLDYLGSAYCPGEDESGLAFSEVRNSMFYISETMSGNELLYEFALTIESVSLENSTWGSIKSAF